MSRPPCVETPGTAANDTRGTARLVSYEASRGASASLLTPAAAERGVLRRSGQLPLAVCQETQ